MKAVPRPPAGLADRIKADIPKYLEPETERGRFSRTVAFPMRIAASILLVVTTLIVTVYLVETPHEEKAPVAAPGAFAPAPRALPQPATASTAPEEVRFEVAEDTAVEMPPIAMATPPPPIVAQRRERADIVAPTQVVESGVERDAEAGIAGGVVGGTAGGVVRNAEPQSVAAQDMVTAEAAAPAMAPTPVAPPAMAEAAPARAALMATGRSAQKMATTEVLGISVDPQNFHRIRATLESGGRPAASEVDVEAIVNYFAGPPARRPRRGVALDVELSPAAIKAEGDHAVLRFSIDTPAANAPAVSNVRLEVVLNDKVVSSHKRIGGTEPLPAQSTLPNGTSVTGLYALELRPNLNATHLVATVRLHYTLNGRTSTISRYVRGRDLPRNWQLSSRRHRLASLGAVWGETLKGAAPGFDIARRAEELATQNPKDAKAKELAAAANASADGGR
ncbi:MAG TPA: hypothetical protein VEO54_25410 [Thermoanaerobaculia bacterium]|nr:hypothetical protein [Thermoanaerobaculia bacterium]